MKEIIFRGKRIEDNLYVYGCLVNEEYIGWFDPRTQLEDVDRVHKDTIEIMLDEKWIGVYVTYPYPEEEEE